MLYAIPNFRRWLCGWLVCVFSSGALAITTGQMVEFEGANHTAKLAIVSMTPGAGTSYTVNYTWFSNVPQAATTADTNAFNFTVSSTLVKRRVQSERTGFMSGSGSLIVVPQAGTGSWTGRYFFTFTISRESGPAMTPSSIMAYCLVGDPMKASFILSGGENGSLYNVYQRGAKIETVQVAPGDEFVYEVETWDDAPVNVFRLNADRTKIDGFWYQTPGAEESSAAGTSTPGSGGSVPPPVNVEAGNGGAGTIVVIGGGSSSGSDDNWKPEGGHGLTADIYREGVEKIVSEVRKGGGGGSGGGDGVDHEGIAGDNPTSGETSSAGNSAASAASSAWGSVSLPVPSVSGSPPLFTITDPFTGTVVDLNPFTSERFGPTAAWLRSLAIYLLVAGFALYAVNVASQTVKDAAQARQAKGNPVMAGTGAQATALLAAAAITVAVLGLIVGLAAWKDISLSGSGGTIIAVLGVNPFGSAPAGVVWMIDQIWPIATSIAVLLGKISFRVVATGAYVTAATVIRFIVP